MKKESIEEIIKQAIIKGIKEKIVKCLNFARYYLEEAKRLEDDFYDYGFHKETKRAIECIEEATYFYEELKKHEGGKDVAVGQK